MTNVTLCDIFSHAPKKAIYISDLWSGSDGDVIEVMWPYISQKGNNMIYISLESHFQAGSDGDVIEVMWPVHFPKKEIIWFIYH